MCRLRLHNKFYIINLDIAKHETCEHVNDCIFKVLHAQSFFYKMCTTYSYTSIYHVTPQH